MGFEPINERICKLHLKGKYRNITIINVHAPTEEKDETKERFYAELQQIQEKVPKHDLLITLGDYNAKIGKEKVYQKVIRNHTHYMTQLIEMGSLYANMPLLTIWL